MAVDAKTDDDGVFHLKAMLGGQTAFWFLPDGYAPSSHLADRDVTCLAKSGEKWIVDVAKLPAGHDIARHVRDLGRFQLEKGLRLHGRVLDESGGPISGIWVNADVDFPCKLIDLPLMDLTERSALTDAHGRFEMQPLPPGNYCVTPCDEPCDPLVEDKTPRPLPAVFLGQRVALGEDLAEREIEFRAVPAVNVEVQLYDSAGRPCPGPCVFLAGQFAQGEGRGVYWKRHEPDLNGKHSFQAPKGLMQTQIRLECSYDSSLRSRISKDAPLSNGAELGTLTEDMTEIAIICYKAPIVSVVKAVDENGNVIEGFKAKIEYAAGQALREGEFVRDDKPAGHVYIGPERDGRWRTWGLLPDEEFTLTVEAPGYRASAQKLSLPEGGVKDLAVRLERE